MYSSSKQMVKVLGLFTKYAFCPFSYAMFCIFVVFGLKSIYQLNRQKFEAVVSLNDAYEVYSKKDLPMKDFENAIWNKYGNKFCDSDRSQVSNTSL